VVAIIVLPIPITYLGILPTYRVHAWFLLFYTPFLCLLILCYLFYVRDSLARAMFGYLLSALQPPEPYYADPTGQRLKRGFQRLQAFLLGVLPVVLVIASMYCVSRYLGSFNQSVTDAAEAFVRRSQRAKEVSMLQEERGKLSRRRPAGRLEGKLSPDSGASRADSLPAPSDSVAVHDYVLRTTAIDEIPSLFELTVLYTGAFAALLIAVSLMGLKEYAREALGLSEHELMLGRYYETGGNE
jgi:hypothetical protein